MIFAKQIALVSERLPIRNHDSGTIEEIATRPLIRSHLCHQIRFNNSTRRSDAPTGTAETKEKYYKSTKHKKKKYKKNKDKYSGKISTKQISTSAKKQNCPTKCTTERRHQQIPRKNADKI